MKDEHQARRIRQVRGAILVAMKILYPAALQAEQLLRSLLVVFPDLEWEHFRKDLCYLLDKGYIRRVRLESRADAALTSWRNRYFRLSAAGVEVADKCVRDQAVEV